MVRPYKVAKSIATAVKDAGNLPSSTTYATIELDPTGEHGDLAPPIVEITVSDLRRDRSRNTELVGHETDAQGNHIGELYRSKFEMVIQVDCITAEGSSNDARTLVADLRDTLRQYDAHQLSQPLPDPDGTGKLYDVKHVVAGDEQVVNDLSMTPAMRRSRLFVECSFVDEFKSSTYEGTASYIKNVLTPADADVETDATTDADLDLKTSDNP